MAISVKSMVGRWMAWAGWIMSMDCWRLRDRRDVVGGLVEICSDVCVQYLTAVCSSVAFGVRRF